MKDYRVFSFLKEIEKYDKVYLYGAGYVCRYFINYLGESIVCEAVECIFVSNETGNLSTIAGIPVYRFNERKIKENDLVITVIRDDEEIIKTLREKSVQNILPYYQIVPNEVDFAEEMIGEWNEQVRRYKDYFAKEKPLFKYLEIETVNRCNGECEFCPVNKNEKQRPYKKMSKDLFINIIDQLYKLNYDGLLALFSNNEPFLDERIEEFAAYAREKLPNAFIYIYTNAKMLTLERFRKIISNLNFLQIDNYNPEDGKTEKIIQIEKEVREKGLEKKLNYFEIDKSAIRYSRGGNSPNSSVKYTINACCCLPFVQMVVRPDGKVSLCCNDALGEHTLGDLTEQKLSDIWYSKKYDQIRDILVESRYDLSTCRYCNYIDRRDIWGKGSL